MQLEDLVGFVGFPQVRQRFLWLMGAAVLAWVLVVLARTERLRESRKGSLGVAVTLLALIVVAGVVDTCSLALRELYGPPRAAASAAPDVWQYFFKDIYYSIVGAPPKPGRALGHLRHLNRHTVYAACQFVGACLVIGVVPAVPLAWKGPRFSGLRLVLVPVVTTLLVGSLARLLVFREALPPDQIWRGAPAAVEAARIQSLRGEVSVPESFGWLVLLAVIVVSLAGLVWSRWRATPSRVTTAERAMALCTLAVGAAAFWGTRDMSADATATERTAPWLAVMPEQKDGLAILPHCHRAIESWESDGFSTVPHPQAGVLWDRAASRKDNSGPDFIGVRVAGRRRAYEMLPQMRWLQVQGYQQLDLVYTLPQRTLQTRSFGEHRLPVRHCALRRSIRERPRPDELWGDWLLRLSRSDQATAGGTP